MKVGGFCNHTCEYLFNDQQDGRELVVFMQKWEVFVIMHTLHYHSEVSFYVQSTGQREG